MRRISRSELGTFKECRRKWYLGNWRALKRRSSGKPGAASVGNRVHAALATAYGNGGGNEMAQAVLLAWRAKDLARWEEYEKLQNESSEREGFMLPDGTLLLAVEHTDQWKKWQADHDLAVIMVEGYFEWVEESGIDAHLTVIDSERSLEAPMDVDGEPVTLVGKLDLRVTDESQGGARLFIDHKTTSSFKDLSQSLSMNEQLLHYHLLEYLNDMEEPTQGGMLNGLRRVKRTPAATPPFYARFTTWHNIDELRSYYLRVRGTIRDMLRVTAELDAGGDHREVCYPSPNERECPWKCPFYAVCPMMDDPRMDSEGFLNMAYEVHNPMERYEEEGDA